MKVFISWSGVASRSVAEALRDWLPNVIQGIEPFVSSKDIDKGANWSFELLRELSDTDFGIICLTQENLLSPWLNYEAGAIMKAISSRAAPVLFGVEKKDVPAPMSQLQLTTIDEDEFKKLMTSMNAAMERPIDGQRLETSVSVWWPSLAKKINNIKQPTVNGIKKRAASFEPDKPRVDLIDKVDEVLQIVDRMERRLRNFNKIVLETYDKSGKKILDSEFDAVVKAKERRTSNPWIRESRSDSTVRYLKSLFSDRVYRTQITRVDDDKIEVTIKSNVNKEDLERLLNEIQTISIVSVAQIQLTTPDGYYEFRHGEIVNAE